MFGMIRGVSLINDGPSSWGNLATFEFCEIGVDLMTLSADGVGADATRRGVGKAPSVGSAGFDFGFLGGKKARDFALCSCSRWSSWSASLSPSILKLSSCLKNATLSLALACDFEVIELSLM